MSSTAAKRSPLFSQSGPWERFQILLLPEALAPCHGEKKKAALTLLLDIVKGGRPEDARVAAGLAFSLTGELSIGFTASMGSTKGFDKVDFTGQTPRQDTVRLVQKLLDDKKEVTADSPAGD